jgi:hypothetical protein
MKTRSAASHNHKIEELKKLQEQFGQNYFEIKELQIHATVRNLLYYNRVAKQYLDVSTHGDVRFPYNPNYEGMCEVYYKQTRAYNRTKKSKKSVTRIVFPEQKQLIYDALADLRKAHGDDVFFKNVSIMMRDFGYSGELVKKNVLKIG